LIGEKRAKPTYSHTLTILNVNLKDSGNFTCHFPSENENITETSFFVQSVLTPVIVRHSATEIRIKDGSDKSITLFCVVQVYPMRFFNNSIKWEKETVDTVENKDSTDSSQINADINNRTKFEYLNETHVNVSIKFDSITKKHNGTYTCSVDQSIYLTEEIPRVEKKSSILVLAVPIAMISYVKAVGASKIYMNWTVNDGNDPVSKFFIQHTRGDTGSFIYYKEPIGGKNTSFVLRDFDPNTKYQFKLSAINSIGSGPITQSEWVHTLAEDPVFVPKIEVKGNSHSTITIGWQPPPQELLDFIHYYELVVYHAQNDSVVEEAIHPQNSRNLPYMFDNLKTATEYVFKVRACNELTRECGNWSDTVNGTTMDGQASEPINLEITCFHSNVSRVNSVSVEWGAPKNPNGKIVSYQIVLKGISTFRSDTGHIRNETFGPKTKSVDGNLGKTFYENVPPNTNYTISVAGVTRSKRIGEQASKRCTMPTSVPENIARVLWGKVQTEENNWIFKVFLPRVSERNGPICCYRIYMVRMTPANPHLKDNPDDYDVVSYEEAHNSTKGGAYIAEIIASKSYQSEIMLGDNKKSVFNKNQEFNGNQVCNACLKHIYKKRPVKPVRTEVPILAKEKTDEMETDEPTTTVKPLRRRRRRQEFQKTLDNHITPTSLSIYDSLSLSLQNKNDVIEILDGPLDINSNYSGFVEIVVQNSDGEFLSVFSEYFHVISPKADPIPEDDSQTNYILNVITHFLAALIVFVLFLICILCLLHRYQKKNVAQGNEVVSLTDSLRLLCHGRPNHHQHRSLVGNVTKPPDMPPILRADLQQAWNDRHKDSDYGFQHEFEMLPDRWNDRTAKNSDSKDNAFKNRYPDIKAYDQTRVKLGMLNGLIGSDYINANFVIGYKERKKFICAQVSFFFLYFLSIFHVS
jgi:protein-tyrosine phosphatase